MSRVRKCRGKSSASLFWSSAATWGGSVPINGDNVVIPFGTTIILDTNTASLGQLTINGALRALRSADVSITAYGIDGTGLLEIGTAADRYLRNATITLTGAFVTLGSDGTHQTNDGVSRGIVFTNGQLVMHGKTVSYPQTKLNASAAAGANTFTFKDSVGWKSGDQIVIGPTDYYGYASGVSSALTLSADTSGTAASTTTNLAAARYGVLQYATDSGMSLSPGTFTKPHTDVPGTIDQRAEVVNTTRNIVIQGANDTHWTSNGHGVHIMVMGLNSTVQMDGVEIRRCGQRAVLGRYPFHWHMLSYTEATGAFVGDTSGHYFKNCAVWNSMNRAVTIHGTCGVLVQNNVAYDIKGHAYFLEDGSERRNTIDGNVAFQVRDPGIGFRIKVHDGSGFNRGSSGFWIVNQDNTITNNLAADCEGHGIWNSMSDQCFGNSALVAIRPRNIPVLSVSGNTGHSNKLFGMQTEFGVTNLAGNTSESKYAPTTTLLDPVSVDYNASVDIVFQMPSMVFWKNLEGGYNNRVAFELLEKWACSDNGNKDLSGVTNLGAAICDHSLMVGTSLNSSTYPSASPRAAFATYHSTLNFQTLVCINFPYVAGVLVSSNQAKVGGGGFRFDDFYLHPLELGFSRNSGMTLIGSDIGFRALPPNLDGAALNNRHWTLAGAIWDTPGYVGAANNYWVYDNAFFTYNLSSSTAVANSNGVSTPDKFYGVSSFYTTFDPSQFTFFAALTVLRVDTSGVTQGTWVVADGNTSSQLGQMRHFAAVKNGRYVLTFPGNSPPTTAMKCKVVNADGASDTFELALPWDSATTPKVAFKSGANLTYPSSGEISAGKARILSSAADHAAVTAGAGDKYWNDTANSLIWVKWVGGLTANYGSTEEDQLFKPNFIIIENGP